tara:strand:- start:510 stop:800 length:291 start_codon:yes stop_codon:yes gene_type:complete
MNEITIAGPRTCGSIPPPYKGNPTLGAIDNKLFIIAQFEIKIIYKTNEYINDFEKLILILLNLLLIMIKSMIIKKVEILLKIPNDKKIEVLLKAIE